MQTRNDAEMEITPEFSIHDLTTGVINILVMGFGWSETEAICRFMGSKTYDRLHCRESKLWQTEIRYIADLFCREIGQYCEAQPGQIPETMEFKVFCVEEYSRKHGIPVQEVISLFDEYGVFNLLEMPPARWQSLENSILDIEEFISASR